MLLIACSQRPSNISNALPGVQIQLSRSAGLHIVQLWQLRSSTYLFTTVVVMVVAVVGGWWTRLTLVRRISSQQGGHLLLLGI